MITAEAQIDIQALQHNFEVLQKKSANRPVIAVIKGNGYGYGAIEVANALPQASKYAVSRIEEGIELRKAGITHPILLLEGCFCADDLATAADLGFETLVHNPEQLAMFEQIHLTKPIKVWLKIDTGMHRIGFAPEKIAECVSILSQNKNVLGDVGFVSHFSCADDLNSTTTLKQLKIFSETTAPFNGPKCLANSPGILYWPQAHFDAVRAGIALYGISPMPDKIGTDHDLTPVMTLKSKIISVRDHKAHQPIGYGETWFSPENTKIAVVAMGYGDGYPRVAPNGTPVWINGRLVPIVGRISMDMLTVNLGQNAQDKVGDTVEFWGNHLPIETIAQKIGTIPYELTIKLAPRVKRTYM